jgi:hypothetical protein
MLLQSQRGLLRAFPAVPASWADVAFRTLRADGAFLVSAERRAAATLAVTVLAEAGGSLRMRDPFEGADFEASLTGANGGAIALTLVDEDGILRCEVPRGSVLVLRRRVASVTVTGTTIDIRQWKQKRRASTVWISPKTVWI